MASLTRSTFICSTLRAAWVFHSAESAIFVSDYVALFRKAAVRLSAGRVVKQTNSRLDACIQADIRMIKYRLVQPAAAFLITLF